MDAYMDLTGQRSGTLVVKELLGQVSGKKRWRCECIKCGNIVELTTATFHINQKMGRDGCKHSKPVVPGDIFGYMTVIEQDEDYIKPKSGAHERRWKCRCVCGRENFVLESNLKALKSTTCGLCSNRISIPEKAIYYYLAKVFPDIQENYRPDFLNGREIDIYIPSLMLGIEYDGERWHKDVQADIEKGAVCAKEGIHLIHAREPKCAMSKEFEYLVITPKPTTNATHMTEPIRKITEIIRKDFGKDIQLDIDCVRDNADICRTIISSAGFNSLQEKYPQLAKEWDYEKNAPLTPDKVAARSGKKAWWICPQGHSFSSVIASRTGDEKCGCPICSNKGTGLYVNGRYIGIHSLAAERPDIAAEFLEEKNHMTARDISVSSNKKMWFKCSACKTEWQSKVNNRTSSNAQGCPACSKGKQSASHRKTRVAAKGSLFDHFPQLCEEWDLEKNDILPKDITAGSSLKVWWKCPKGHSYQAAINHRTGKNPTGCPKCRGLYRKVQNIETGEVFSGPSEAAKSLGIKIRDKISAVCRGERNMAGGYHWRYLDE